MKHTILALICAAAFLAVPSQGASILVGQCVEGAPCWLGPNPVPWSDTLNLTDLQTLGLGSTVALKAVQTAEFNIVLGITTLTFTTSGGPVIDTINAFSGGTHADPCFDCALYVVGEFFIPSNATALTISGTFGTNDGSAGVNLFVDSDVCGCVFPPDPVPEPATSAMVGSAVLGLLGLAGVRRRLKRPRLL